MAPKSHSFMLLVFCAALLIAACSCGKAATKNAPGPGGLPSGTVRGAAAPETPDDPAWPIYPGSKRIAMGSYQSSDPIGTVSSYYVTATGVQPKAGGEMGQTLTFMAKDFILVLIPMDPAGTEIHFGKPDTNVQWVPK